MALLANVRKHIVFVAAPQAVQDLQLWPGLKQRCQIAVRQLLRENERAGLMANKEAATLAQPHGNGSDEQNSIYQTNAGRDSRIGTRDSTHMKIGAVDH
jgi:hypothetical protein